MPRLELLRQELKRRGVYAFIQPSNDEFLGEYIPDSAKRLEWLTGFSGSAGTAIITLKKAAFFTDGRYTLQAQKELNKAFEIHNYSELTPSAWLKTQGVKLLGIDSWLHTPQSMKTVEKQGIVLKPIANPIDSLWEERPAEPNAPVQPHVAAFAGETSLAKRHWLVKELKKHKADAFFLTAPDSICWLLNIRGQDVPFTPFVLCRALFFSNRNIVLFIDQEKITALAQKHLGTNVLICPPSKIEAICKKLAKKKVMLDPAQSSIALFDILQKANAKIVQVTDPCQLEKSRKNPVELANMEEAHVQDGIALVKFLHWFEAQKKTTEIDAAEKLLSFRKEREGFQGSSFASISGFGSNGAIVHYRAQAKTNKAISGNGLYLIDSGGQYLKGTTDVTRTVLKGKATLEQKEHFTLVLKGHIAIARARFPKGTSGSQLDCLARYALWQEGLDYDHGTGHGVGSYLSVHEGPQRISKRGGDVPLEPGMVLSNEPGFYKPSKYGIRIENLVYVAKEKIEKGKTPFFKFETLTLAPIDIRLIDKTLLSQEELLWLDQYHQKVQETLEPFLSKSTNEWLRKVTRPIAYLN